MSYIYFGYPFGGRNECRTRFEDTRFGDTRFECGLRLPKALRACEWFECRTRFEDTRFECGLRLPKALRACESLECRTRFERWDLTKGG